MLELLSKKKRQAALDEARLALNEWEEDFARIKELQLQVHRTGMLDLGLTDPNDISWEDLKETLDCLDEWNQNIRRHERSIAEARRSLAKLEQSMKSIEFDLRMIYLLSPLLIASITLSVLELLDIV